MTPDLKVLMNQAKRSARVTDLLDKWWAATKVAADFQRSLDSTYKTAASEYALFDSTVEARQDFLYGSCHTLTLVLHKMLGWPCVIFNCDEGCMHSAVKASDGRYLDAAGFVTLEQLNRRYQTKLEAVDVEPDAILTLGGDDPEDEWGYGPDAKVYAQKLIKRLGFPSC